MVTILPEILAIAVGLLAIIAEFFHLRRISKVKYLAFGPGGQAAAWTALAPVARVIAIAAATWGFATLLFVVEAKVHNEGAIEEGDYKHLLIVVDVSPSMRLKDAGTDGKLSRRKRASDVLESLFNRIPMRQFKISIIAVYTDAKMMLEDSLDHEVVRHIMEEMPMFHAFKPGKTNLMSGIKQASKTAKGWNPKSAYMLMLTDGDTVPTSGMPKLPASIKDVVVVGVGDSRTGSFIDGHQSRQDVSTLRQIANRLRGVFHNGNEKHLTSQLVSQFVQTDEESKSQKWTRREWAMLAAVSGSFLYSIIPILLHYLGTSYVAGKPRIVTA